MSSVGSSIAQIGARKGYFIATGNVSTYTITQDVNAVASAPVLVSATGYTANAILEDMGEIAKYGGFLFRKVRAVSQVPTGTDGSVPSYFIAMPGGEYPVQGVAAAGLNSIGGAITVALVARLG